MFSFKSFTNNISSFIGLSEKKAAEENSQISPSSSEATPQQNVPDSATIAEQAATDDSDARETKAPPPRPAPPLTPASSVCKPDPQASPTLSKASELTESADSNTASLIDVNEITASSENEQANKKDKIDETLDEVAEKAKQWGSYLFNMTKSAGASVSAKAKELKKVVQEHTIIGDFVKEQDKFVTEKKEKARAKEAAVPPWVGYNEEETMKQQMLSLSNDKRNFLRNPPSGVQFHFDYDTCFPVAMATLAEDEKLQKMRFDLVPKQVSEHDFWRNYFYRVSLIKQSTQLTSLARQSNTSSNSLDGQKETNNANKNIDIPDTNKAVPVTADASDVTEDADLVSGQEEFVSDAYNLEISDEDLIKEMEALRSSPGTDGDWGFEIVGGAASAGLNADEAALEKEIMDEMINANPDLK